MKREKNHAIRTCIPRRLKEENKLVKLSRRDQIIMMIMMNIQAQMHCDARKDDVCSRPQ
jgi:hypothetical protein